MINFISGIAVETEIFVKVRKLQPPVHRRQTSKEHS